jgi:hypothetical protein
MSSKAPTAGRVLRTPTKAGDSATPGGPRSEGFAGGYGCSE